MLLVEYSDSESSGAEGPRASQATTDSKVTSNSHKPAFQKVVDRSNPHKIRVNLPTVAKSTKDEGEDGSEPPSKRAKFASNALSGFNSLLPAPKKVPALNGGSGAKRGGLGSGVNLKTGATPGFSRDEGSRMDGSGGDKPTEAEPSNSGTASNDGYNTAFQEPAFTITLNSEPKIQGNSMMFKPLSVARKPKKTTSSAGIQKIPNQAPVKVQQSKITPMISLFSTGDVQEFQNKGLATTGEYQPMIYLPSNSKPNPSPPFSHDIEASESLEIPNDLLAQANHNNQEPSLQSLKSIASDLNLSASAKRQLLGRQRNNPSNIKIVNFNTDKEYAANEMLRQAGEQVQHNPVRAIAPGKHSLKQLVNAATNQKEALEEQFALGRRNRKEAGGKYGWGPGWTRLETWRGNLCFGCNDLNQVDETHTGQVDLNIEAIEAEQETGPE